MSYDPREKAVIRKVFGDMLEMCTADGGEKRQRGEKPPWWIAAGNYHEAAVFSHLRKWKLGERRDADSGAHPCLHAAWRLIAIAYQETFGEIPPGGAD